MAQNIFSKLPVAVLGTAALLLLAGCVGDMPHRGAWVAAAQNKRVQMAFNAPDMYFYFPDQAVYYNQTRHCYVYLENGLWFSGTVPPRVSVEELRSARSVRLPFHDAPSLHHTSVAKSYPENTHRPEPVRRPVRTNNTNTGRLSSTRH